MDHIFKYFTSLTDDQKAQFETIMRLYPEWNSKINVISRKDIENLEVNHILHSLAIAKMIRFTPGSHIMDFGCGGGLPGLPLAVLMPDVNFHLIDRVGKKLRVAADIAAKSGINNVTFQHGDVGECHEKFDFAVSRAVMPQPEMVKLLRRNISSSQRNALPNGIISLKGGNLDAELSKIAVVSEIMDISTIFDEDYFKTKKVVYTPVI